MHHGSGSSVREVLGCLPGALTEPTRVVLALVTIVHVARSVGNLLLGLLHRYLGGTPPVAPGPPGTLLDVLHTAGRFETPGYAPTHALLHARARGHAASYVRTPNPHSQACLRAHVPATILCS